MHSIFGCFVTTACTVQVHISILKHSSDHFISFFYEQCMFSCLYWYRNRNMGWTKEPRSLNTFCHNIPLRKYFFSRNVQLKLPAMSFFFFKSNILFIFHKESGELLTSDWAASLRKQLNLIFLLSSYAFKYWISPRNNFEKGPRPEFCASSSTWPRWWSRFEFGIDPTNQHLITTSASPPFGTSFANLTL